MSVLELNLKILELEQKVSDLEFQLSAITEEDEEFDLEVPETPLPITKKEEKEKLEKPKKEIKPKKEVKPKKEKKVEIEIDYSVIKSFLIEYFNKNKDVKNLTSDLLYDEFVKYEFYNELITKHKFRKETKPILLRRGNTRFIIGLVQEEFV